MKKSVIRHSYITAIISTIVALCFFFGPGYQIIEINNPNNNMYQSIYSMAFNLRVKGNNYSTNGIQISSTNSKNNPRIGMVIQGELFNVLFAVLLLIGLVAYLIYLYRNKTKDILPSVVILSSFLGVSIVCLVLTFCSRAFVKNWIMGVFPNSNPTSLSIGWGAILSGIMLAISTFALAIALIFTVLAKIHKEIKKINNSAFLDNMVDKDEERRPTFLSSVTSNIVSSLKNIGKKKDKTEDKENNEETSVKNDNKTDENEIIDATNVIETVENKEDSNKDNEPKEDKYSSIENRLVELKKLYEKELISEDEYQKRKEEICKEI